MTTQKFSIVVATDEKRGIGKDNKIPWHIKEDLLNLKKLTQSQVVIVGANTYISMQDYYDVSGREMPGKVYIVVTDDRGFNPSCSNAICVYSIDEAIKKAKSYGTDEVFIIGGSQIFKQMIKLANKLYLTIVKGDFDCDTFFPGYSDFKNVISSKREKNETNEFEFKILERITKE